MNIDITILAVSYVVVITYVPGPFLFCLGNLLLTMCELALGPRLLIASLRKVAEQKNTTLKE